MIKSIKVARQRDVAAALGSVRAEGLKPSVKTQKRLSDYASGKISASNLRKVTISEMRRNQSR